jgi:hypothetical protein
MGGVDGRVDFLLCVSQILYNDAKAPVTLTCNPNYQGGRDLEDYGLKPERANSMRPYLEKNPS